ncbi:hypothetical protein MLD38_013128 [Melastoma candidum]|uniref:Uncharacterized protein n=1 Tax=Melastoma candidum TaxID=119954 RepID=A0ACB9R9Q1_9MYRT|nr:hypothetical protein MLD38_013128 [Melastoma candidum]
MAFSVLSSSSAVAVASTLTAVITWGTGEDGQLGLGDNEEKEQSELPHYLSGWQVVYMGLEPERNTGASANNQDGKLMPSPMSISFRRLSVDGIAWLLMIKVVPMLGFDSKQIDVPVCFQGLDRVRLIAVGAFHNLALKEDGTQWAWGNNEYGQLGTGDIQPRSQPVLVNGLSDYTLVEIAARGWQSTALTYDEKVFSWGRGEHSRLGFGDNDKSSIMCGAHSIALTREGRVFSNEHSFLDPHSDDSTQFLVFQVPFLRKLKMRSLILQAFTKSLVMTTLSEVGDRTFCVAAILAMRYPRKSVLLGCLVSVVENDLKTGSSKSKATSTSKENESKPSSNNSNVGYVPKDDDGDSKKKQRPLIYSFVSPVFLKAFSLIFFGEWGDKSQLATIGLAADEDTMGVVLGGIVGQILCTVAAVIGGKSLASRISERLVTLLGGFLFLIFGVQSLLSMAAHP